MPVAEVGVGGGPVGEEVKPIAYGGFERQQKLEIVVYMQS